MGTLLLFALVLMLCGSLTSWSYGRRWDHDPSGLSVALIILVVLVVTHAIGTH